MEREYKATSIRDTVNKSNATTDVDLAASVLG